MKTPKPPKTNRAKPRFVGDLRWPIVRPNSAIMIAADLLQNIDPNIALDHAEYLIQEEFNRKILLVSKQYGIRNDLSGLEFFSQLAVRLCEDFVPGCKIVDKPAQKGRRKKDWSELYSFVKSKQLVGMSAKAACVIYRDKMGGARKPAADTLKNAFHRFESEKKRFLEGESDALTEAIVQARRAMRAGPGFFREPEPENPPSE